MADRVYIQLRDYLKASAGTTVPVTSAASNADLDDLAVAWDACSDAMITQQTREVFLIDAPVLYGNSGTFARVVDVMRLDFDVAGGVKYYIRVQGPKVSCFDIDGETVDLTNALVSNLVTWLLIYARSDTGALLDACTGGVRETALAPDSDLIGAAEYFVSGEWQADFQREHGFDVKGAGE